MKKSIVPTIYKFEFYAHKSHWKHGKSEKEALEEIEELLMYCEDLNIISRVKITDYTLEPKSNKIL